MTDNDLPQDEDNDLPQDEDGVDEGGQDDTPYFVPGPVHRQVAPAPVTPAAARGRAGKKQQPGVGAAPAGAAPAVRQGHGRPRGKIGHLPNSTFESREVELLWPEILDWLKANGKTPYDVVVRVIRIEPPPREVFVKTFDGAAVQGSQNMLAADAFIDFVARYYHMGSVQQGPALYHFMFMWKATGQLFASGELRLPAQADLLRQYQSQQGMPTASYQQPLPSAPLPPYGVGGLGAPPGGYQQSPPLPQAPWQQQQAYQQPAMPQAAPHENETIWQLRQEIKLLRERQELEAQAARQQQRQPGFGRPTGYGRQPEYPQPQASQEEVVARTVRVVLSEMGFGPPPPARVGDGYQPPFGGRRPGVAPGVGAAPGYQPPWQQYQQPPPVSPQDAAASASTGVGSLKQLVQTAKELREVGLAIDKVFGRGEEEVGVGEAPAVATETPEAADPGFEVADVGPDVKWRDGRPVKIARDKNGNIDWMGVALANPPVTETIVEKFGTFMQSMGERMRPGGMQPGVGQPMEQQQQYQPPPQLHGGQPTAADYAQGHPAYQPTVEEQPAEDTTNGAPAGNGFNLS